MFSEEIRSLKELEKSAKKIIEQFPEERVFAFSGKMGAGKTTFIQAFCRAMGSDDNVTSPTFALINEYKIPTGKSIFHFDFYRIKNIEEAFDLGYEDYFYSNNYCFIEWPERVEPLLPQHFTEVKIDVSGNGARLISVRTI